MQGATIPLKKIEIEGNGVHLSLKATINGQIYNLVLDTGASQSVFDLNQAEELGILNSIEKSEMLSSGLGTNSMESHTATIKNIKIGDWQKKKLNVAVLDLTHVNQAYEKMGIHRVAGILGGDVLNAFDAVINYKNSILTLK